MAKINKLKAIMVEREDRMDEVADKIGLHISTFYRKLRHPEDIRIWELKNIMVALELSKEQILDIFFDD